MSQLDCSFTGYNNTRIYAKKDLVDNPKASIVIVHGVFEHLDRYDYLVSKLNKAGYNVYRYDARGHGRSEGKKGDLKHFTDYLEDLDVYVEKVREENKSLKLVLLGHSMGGLVATAYACTHPGKIDYLVLSGACNRTPKEAKALRIIPMFMTPLFKYKNVLGDAVCSDKAVVEAYNNDPLVVKVGSFRLMKNAFIKGCDLVGKNIENINVPTLVMHGEKDGVVVVETGYWTYEHLKVEDKALKVYEGLYHEIFNEVRKEEVIQDLIDWLKKHVEGK